MAIGGIREWRYTINYGPEGEANYAMVYDSKGELVGNLKIHHAIQVVSALNAPGTVVTALLDLYDKETEQVPLGHENRERGGSTYNWRKSVVRDLRNMMSSGPILADATPNPLPSSPVSL